MTVAMAAVDSALGEVPIFKWNFPGVESWHVPAHWTSEDGNSLPDPLAEVWIDNDGTPQIGDAASAGNVYIGRTLLGHLDVIGPHGSFDAETLFVGSDGIGTFAVNSGGQANSKGSVLGKGSDGSGSAFISGQDSTWVNSEDIVVGSLGDGALSVSDGGLLRNRHAVVGETADSFGTVTVSDPGSRWENTGTLRIGKASTATVSVMGGGTITANAASVGEQLGALGTVTITGQGALWQNAGDLSVGNGAGGNGLLVLSDGGRSEAGNTYFGRTSESFASSIVEGTGTQLKSADGLYVGHGGNGTLIVTSGGHVISDSGYLASEGSGVGSVTLDGGNANWHNSETLQVGVAGTGTLVVRADAKMENGGDVVVGVTSTGDGRIEVSGSSAQLVSEGQLRVGESGRGRLQIEDGGVASTAGGTVGTNVDSIGIASVSGSGSAWNVSGPLQVGASGYGELTIANQGTVNVSNGELIVGSPGQVNGDGVVVGNLVNQGTVAPGLSPGTLTIDGEYSQGASGRLLIELLSPESFDRLLVSEDVSLGGTLEVVLDEGFMPHGTVTFDFLDWGTRSGSFGELVLPTLGNILTWDTSKLYSEGVLSVTGPLLPGDFNGNGVVDAADYTIWRDSLGREGVLLSADANENGIVDDADYLAWKSGFNGPMGSGANSPVPSNVPEPHSILLVAIAGIIAIARWARNRRF